MDVNNGMEVFFVLMSFGMTEVFKVQDWDLVKTCGRGALIQDVGVLLRSSAG